MRRVLSLFLFTAALVSAAAAAAAAAASPVDLVTLKAGVESYIVSQPGKANTVSMTTADGGVNIADDKGTTTVEIDAGTVVTGTWSLSGNFDAIGAANTLWFDGDDLVALLLDHANPAAGTPQDIEAVAERVAVACLGDKHLWQDLHFASRAELSALMGH